MSVTPYKTTCSAFGCARYTRRIGKNGLYLYPGHWPTVPKRLCDLNNRAYRNAEKDMTLKNWKRAERFWDRCVDHANRAQFGI